MNKALGITEVVLRDAHQSLLATRLRLEDMLPIAPIMDEIGFWSIESWGGATFDSCIRYLGEDPWVRIRELKKAMPKTKQQMLFRGQNILGYRHYADDLVEKFVERAHINGVDVFRIFDAMNDVRNLKTAINAAVKVGAHAQGTLSYTVSPVHTLDSWLTMARQLEDMGAHSLCIKDMAGLLKPYYAENLIKQMKKTVSIPIALHCHATTGLSVATHMKAIDADIDVIDTAISSMSMTYGQSPTETIVSIVEDTERDTGLDMKKLAKVAAYFREVRKKYSAFEGSLKGVDARILVAQVPGGMLTNMELQLKEQEASDRLDEVLTEIPKVRKDLGYIPLVTPTSQIVGTQAVLNVLTGKRYQSITKETAGVLKGEYGATPDKVNPELQTKVLKGDKPVTCRPADLIEPEVNQLTQTLKELAREKNITLSPELIDDVLIYALFPQIGLKYLENRNNPAAFEPVPTLDNSGNTAKTNSQTSSSQPGSSQPKSSQTEVSQVDSQRQPETYSVSVDGNIFEVIVAPGGEISQITDSEAEKVKKPPVMDVSRVSAESTFEALNAPLAGNIFKVLVNEGDQVEAGEEVIIMEAMKMETEIRAKNAGKIQRLHIKEGDSVSFGQPLLSLG